MNGLIYFLVALFSTIIGATAGVGGGVIIKPVLDLLGDYDVKTIGVLSAITIFSMTVVSVGKHIIGKTKIKGKIAVFLAFGSVFGGYLGDEAMNRILSVMDKSFVTLIQNGILSVLMILIFIYVMKRDTIRSFKTENIGISIATGFLLGLISSFLGIGGGPLNVAVFMLVFSFDTKTSAVCSLITILFAQIAKLVTVGTGTGFASFDLSVLPFMVVAAIVGGFIGTKLNRMLPEKQITKVFNVVLVLVFLICVYNMGRAVIL